MKTKDFIDSLAKKYESNLTIKENKNIPGLGNIFYNDFEICSCPFEDIYEEVRPNYTVTFPGDFVMQHPSMDMIEAKINNFITRLKTDTDFSDLVNNK